MAVRRLRACPDAVDLALDVAGNGILPELIALTGGPDHVLTGADFTGAQTHASASAEATPAVPCTP